MERETLNDGMFEIETLQDWDSAKAEQDVAVVSGGCSNSSNNTAE